MSPFLVTSLGLISLPLSVAEKPEPVSFARNLAPILADGKTLLGKTAAPGW